jgi:hypothetical protein
MTNDDRVKHGAVVTGFIGGHVAHLDVKAEGTVAQGFTSGHADTNGEALRRVLTAALCWLDGNEQLVMPAVSGDVLMRAERKSP